jgi:hypothetical protein
MSESELWKDEEGYRFLKYVELILILILYVDLIFSIWFWIKPNTFYTYVDRVYIILRFSGISLFAYFYTKFYEIYKKMWLFLQKSDFEAEDVSIQIRRMKKIYNLFFGIMVCYYNNCTIWY